jgi:hypothetical protein
VFDGNQLEFEDDVLTDEIDLDEDYIEDITKVEQIMW